MPRRDQLLGPLPDRELAEPRPDDEAPDEEELVEPEGDDDEGPRRPVTNGDLARVFHEIGDILEVKGENKFKTVAYHRAADAIARAPFDVGAAYGSGDLRPIPGVGAAITDKIVEVATTGRMAYFDKLREEIPASLVELLRIPGVGPQTVRIAWEGLGVTSLAEMKAAAQANRLRELKGISASTEQRILEGIEKLETRPRRLLLHRAQATSDDLAGLVAAMDGVQRVVQAGSLRRRRETIGDLDLLVETDRPDTVIEGFTALGVVDQVLGAGRAKAAVTVLRGPQVDLMIMPPGEAGTYLVHFTGSADHNIRLRGIARDRGWSLSEKGFVRIDEEGKALEGDAADLRTFEDEAGVYRFLDLAWIPPELREDRGEVEAARDGTLPDLITLGDLRGDLHSHSEWSDGVHPIEVMAEAARRRGYGYQVLTDHSQSLGIAHGLDPDRVEQQRAIIAELNARFAAEEAAGDLPPGADPGGFRLLHGCELEVTADAELDYEDDLLARFDLVVASVHVARKQPRAQLTKRTLTAIRSPHVDVIAHPSGRMIQTRDDLDLDWDAVFEAAATTGTALEMNGSPHRLDLAPERARRAVELGCILSIDSDAHRTEELDYVRWGVDQARRAWVEPRHVLNTRSREDLLAHVAGKPGRV